MRILVMEDDPHLLHSLTATLREENHAVNTAEDGLYKAQNDSTTPSCPM
ncbi:hypothetical protein [Prosthecobacter sp.]